MVRYFYAWTPLAIVAGTAVLLTIPWLALIALMVVSLAALAALAWAIIWVPLALVRAIGRRWHGRRGVSVGIAALSPAQPGFRRGHAS